MLLKNIKVKDTVSTSVVASANTKSCKCKLACQSQLLTSHYFVERRVLIASIMEEFNKGAWEELIERCEESGVDAFEVNFSCPHGMPERKMGMAMGQDPEILQVMSFSVLTLTSNSIV